VLLALAAGVSGPEALEHEVRFELRVDRRSAADLMVFLWAESGEGTGRGHGKIPSKKWLRGAEKGV